MILTQRLSKMQAFSETGEFYHKVRRFKRLLLVAYHFLSFVHRKILIFMTFTKPKKLVPLVQTVLCWYDRLLADDDCVNHQCEDLTVLQKDRRTLFQYGQPLNPSETLGAATFSIKVFVGREESLCRCIARSTKKACFVSN